MAYDAKAELGSIKRELDKIIRELDDVSHGVRYDFRGVGNEICADRIDGMANQLRTARRMLNNIDTRTFDEDPSTSNAIC